MKQVVARKKKAQKNGGSLLAAALECCRVLCDALEATKDYDRLSQDEGRRLYNFVSHMQTKDCGSAMLSYPGALVLARRLCDAGRIAPVNIPFPNASESRASTLLADTLAGKHRPIPEIDPRGPVGRFLAGLDRAGYGPRRCIEHHHIESFVVDLGMELHCYCEATCSNALAVASQFIDDRIIAPFDLPNERDLFVEFVLLSQCSDETKRKALGLPDGAPLPVIAYGELEPAVSSTSATQPANDGSAASESAGSDALQLPTDEQLQRLGSMYGEEVAEAVRCRKVPLFAEDVAWTLEANRQDALAALQTAFKEAGVPWPSSGGPTDSQPPTVPTSTPLANMFIEYPAHEAAAIFPMMAEAELHTLADDIKRNGQVQPATLYQGKVIDGRNRQAACKLIWKQTTYQEWTGTGSVVEWILSANLHRRHLTDSQRAVVAAKAKAAFEVEARERSRANLQQNKGSTEGLDPAPRCEGKSAERAAQMLQVSVDTTKKAAKVLKLGAPALVTAMESGAVSIDAAAAVATLPPEEQRDAVEQGRVKETAKQIRIANAAARTAPAANASCLSEPAPAEQGDQIEDTTSWNACGAAFAPAIFENLTEIHETAVTLGEAAGLVRQLLETWRADPGPDVDPILPALQEVLDKVTQAANVFDASIVPRAVCTACMGQGCSGCGGKGWLDKANLAEPEPAAADLPKSRPTCSFELGSVEPGVTGALTELVHLESTEVPHQGAEIDAPGDSCSAVTVSSREPAEATAPNTLAAAGVPDSKVADAERDHHAR
jgi:ParB-like chromosome segregation protein Spo0J